MNKNTGLDTSNPLLPYNTHLHLHVNLGEELGERSVISAEYHFRPNHYMWLGCGSDPSVPAWHDCTPEQDDMVVAFLKRSR